VLLTRTQKWSWLKAWACTGRAGAAPRRQSSFSPDVSPWSCTPYRWTVRNSVGARKLMPPPRCEEGPGVPSSGGRASLAGRVRREHGSAQQDDVQIVPPFPSEPHHVAAIAPASEREARTPRDGTLRSSGDQGSVMKEILAYLGPYTHRVAIANS
jgi:hypothetical protein